MRNNHRELEREREREKERERGRERERGKREGESETPCKLDIQYRWGSRMNGREKEKSANVSTH